MSRLDHFLFCGVWGDIFLNRHQVVSPWVSSDHNPILLEPCGLVTGSSPFRFKELWFQTPNFLKVVDCE